MNGRTNIVMETWYRELRRPTTAANPFFRLEDYHRQSRLRQDDSRSEPIRPRAHYHRIVAFALVSQSQPAGHSAGHAPHDTT